LRDTFSATAHDPDHSEDEDQQFPASLFRPLLNRVISSFMVAK